MSFRDEKINKLTEHIERYPQFSERDKAIWKEKALTLPPDLVIFLTDLFENSPEDIIWLNENIKTKEKILEEQNEEAWQRLIDGEEIYLEQFVNG
jgi:hypothetical protein